MKIHGTRTNILCRRGYDHQSTSKKNHIFNESKFKVIKTTDEDGNTFAMNKKAVIEGNCVICNGDKVINKTPANPQGEDCPACKGK